MADTAAPSMSRFVALFRGINVGKAKRIAMADLRALLVSLGSTQVQTLLNSGNAVFEGPAESATAHAQRMRSAVAAELGIDAPVIVKSAHDMASVVAGNPLAAIGHDSSRLLVVLTRDKASLAALAPWARQAVPAQPVPAADRFVVGPHAAYLWCATGLLDSPLAAALLKGLGEAGTTRNWTTIEKIQTLLSKGD
jgi:uncharacterized protein (DUF1697 family)